MGREQKRCRVSAFASASYLLLLVLHDHSRAQAASESPTYFSASASGTPSERIIVCEKGGREQVASLETTIPYHDSLSFSSFVLICKDSELGVLPAAAESDMTVVCADRSTIGSCHQIALETLQITACVKAEKTPTEKTVQWKIYPPGFPRTPQKWKTGCVFLPPSVKKLEPQEANKKGVAEKSESPAASSGCLVTVLVRQAPPVVVNNTVVCSFGRGGTVTPVVSVTSSKPFVRIDCGSGAEFIPARGHYCVGPNLDTCAPRSLQDIFPYYLDAWWKVEDKERVLTIPATQLPKRGKKLFFGCVLRGQTVECLEGVDYYCVIPVLFVSAAQPQWGRTPLKDSATLCLTTLLFSSFIVTRVT